MLRRYMRVFSCVACFLAQLFMTAVAQDKVSTQACNNFYQFSAIPLTGKKAVSFCDEYKGKVILVVNTASKCGFTWQYEGLEALYRQHKQQGLVVLGFPSNQFGGQEPGTNAQIQDFCRSTYGVEFPMFQKSVVVGEQATDIWRYLAKEAKQAPQWNFYKYLIDRDGRVIDVFSSLISPESESFNQKLLRLL